jgi:hypothetical protein
MAWAAWASGVDRLLHVAGLDALTRHVTDNGSQVTLAQAALGIGVLARPGLTGGVAAGGQIVGDQVRARTFHVRRVNGQPGSDLLQHRRQPILAHRLALPAAPVLIPDRLPSVPQLPSRVHRHPRIRLHRHTVVTARGFTGVSAHSRGTVARARSAPGTGSPNGSDAL